MRVQPSTATPISVLQIPNHSHLKSSNHEINRTRIRNSAPPIVVVSKNGSVERSVPNGMYEKNSATRSTPSPSTFVERTQTSSLHLRNKRSAEFVDRDPVSAESKSDYLDPLDFCSLHQIYCDSQVSSEKKRPKFSSVECIYREDHRYLHNDDFV
uniref:Uncharacterized protein n=1 Tax=Ascaris lumbricoides TaxID=6252 RepID=A0A0M3I5V0_ASCLU